MARQVCVRSNSHATIEGSISQIGNQYSLILKAVNCSSGATLTSVEATAQDKNHVLTSLNDLASSIRGKLGESLRSVQKYDAPLEMATTTSLDALKSYSMGREALIQRADNTAQLRFSNARWSSIPILRWPMPALERFTIMPAKWIVAGKHQKAYDLTDRVSDRERFYITSHYEQFYTGNYEKAISIYEL